MNDQTLNRRRLFQLAVAALGGLTAGALVGCNSGQTPTADTDKKKEKDKKEADATPRLLQDPHVCRGINTCKNKGKKGTTNECAGQAHCATVTAHDCNGMNDLQGARRLRRTPGRKRMQGQGRLPGAAERQNLAQGAQAL